MSWADVFLPSVPIWELLLRGSIIYLSVFIFMRIVGGRPVGELNTADLILVLIISEAASAGLAGNAHSISDSLIVVAVVIAWGVLLDFVGFHWKWAENVLKPKPKRLIADGVLNRQTAQRELLTRSETLTQLREHGFAQISEVYRAYVEPDGRISVLQEPSER